MLKSIITTISTLVFCSIVLTTLIVAAEPESGSSENPDLQRAFDLETTARNLAVEWSGASLNRAIVIYSDVSIEWEKQREFERAADCLREIANFQILLGKNEFAVAAATKAELLDKKYENPTKKIKTYSLLAIASLRLGRLNDAKRSAKTALEISSSITDHDGIATAFFTQGQIDYDDGKFDQAIVNYEKALDNWKTAGLKSNEAKTLYELSYALMTKDDLPGALGRAETAFSIFREIGNLRGQVVSMIATAVMNSKLGNKQKALKIFLESERQFPSDIDYLEKGDMYNHTAAIYSDFGDTKIGLDYHLKAFKLFQHEKNPFAQLATISDLGTNNYKLGNRAEALGYFDLGFQLARSIRSDYFFAVLCQNLGNLYIEDDPKKALQYFELARPKFEKLNIKTHLAVLQTKIGIIHQANGEMKLARTFFESALGTSREIKNDFVQAEILFQLSQIELTEEHYENALTLVRESIEKTEDLYSDVLNADLRRTYLSDVYYRYEFYINLLMQVHEQDAAAGHDMQALQASERSRSRSLLETMRLFEANFIKDANPEMVQKEKELRNVLGLKADKLTELLSSGAKKDETDEVEEEIRTLENDLENIKAEFKQNSPVYSAIQDPPAFDIGDFQQNILDDETVLLEFALGEKDSYLWLVGKNEVSSFVLPARNIIEGRIERIRQTFESRQILPNEDIEAYQKRMTELETVFKQEAAGLSNELLGQATEKIAGMRLIIVPDGKLALLPLSALPFPNSDDALVARNEIVYEPSASLLNLFAKLQDPKKLPGKDLLVFADPVFSDDDQRLTAKEENESSLPAVLGLNLRDFRVMDENGKIPRLFATQEEADSISDAVGKSRTTVLTGFDASRERVLSSDISDYRILHFATHGLVDVNRPEVSSIILSRFDQKGQKREGFLRLQDIYALNLASDLVVLSACQSGVGKEIRGEGVMSLNNAFLQAGARSVLSSAWKVDDAATAELMKRFYTNLANQRLTAPEALRRAQIEMSESTQFKSPFYWAAFSAQGEFRRPISLSTNYLCPIVFVILALAGVALYWRLRSSRRHRTEK